MRALLALMLALLAAWIFRDAGAELFEFSGGGFFPTRLLVRVIDIRAVRHLVKNRL